MHQRRDTERDAWVPPSAQTETRQTVADNVARARERAFQRLFEEVIESRKAQAEEKAEHRRNFMRTCFLGAVAAGCSTILGSRIYSKAEKQSSTRSSSLKSSHASKLALTAAFTWENILFQVGQHAFAQICWAHELPIGNAGLQPKQPDKSGIEKAVSALEKNPNLCRDIYLQAGFIQPIAEELGFRIIPDLVVGGAGYQWSTGLLTSLAFSLQHNLIDSGAPTKSAIRLTPNLKVSLDYLPLTQFTLGAFCWYTARSYGSLAPIFAHVANNQLAAISLAWGGKRLHDQFHRLLAEELGTRNVESA